jgi:hypothetical protein
MKIAIVAMIVVCLGLPLLAAVRLWRLDERSGAVAATLGADAALPAMVVLIAGRWDIPGLPLRPLLTGLLAAAMLRAVLRHVGRPWAHSRPVWRSHPGTLTLLALIGAALLWLLSGLVPARDARPLALPVAADTVVAAHGGGTLALNHHAGHPAQSLAVDLTALMGGGVRAAGVLPGDLGSYAIFDAQVVAPCAGDVVATRDGMPDLTPPRRDPAAPAGNLVVVRCDDIRITLAHLRRGSVAVAPGDRVTTGAPLGRVGNSGNTSEPHLHVHAVDAETGRAVPILLGGRWPARGTVWRDTG